MQGLSLLQKNYGLVGVKVGKSSKSIVMVSANTGKPIEIENIPLTQKTVYFKAECNFRNRADIAHFFYSLNRESVDENR